MAEQALDAQRLGGPSIDPPGRSAQPTPMTDHDSFGGRSGTACPCQMSIPVLNEE